MEQARQIAGPPPAPPPGREELESAEFAYPGRLLDPGRQKIQQEYRSRLGEGERLAQSQYRTEKTSYEATIRSMVAQFVGAAETGARIESQETRADKRAREIESRRERTASAALKKSAKLQLSRALERAEKYRNPTDLLEQAMAKQDPTAFQARYDQAVEQAYANYEMVTGEPAPGRDAPTTPRAPLGQPPGMSAVQVKRPAGGLPSAGPPGAPITPEEERRASQIIQRIKRQNLQTTAELSQGDRDFLLDYYRRGGKLGQ
jgi:hypothetical protein